MRWHERLKARLLIPILVVLFISMITSLSWFYYLERDKLLNRTGKETALVSEVIKAGIRNQMLKKYSDMTQETISLIQRNAGLREISLIKKNGVVAYSSSENDVGKQIELNSGTCKICHRNGAQPKKLTVIMTGDDGNRVFRSVNPIDNEQECRTCHRVEGNLLGVLIVDQYIGRALLDIKSVQQSLFTIGVVTVIVLVGLIFIIVELLVQRPVNTLIEGTRKIKAGDLDTRIQLRVKGEMSELGGAFNSMVGSIKQQISEIEEKNFELSTLYSMVERITKTINLNELRRIVLDIIMEVFSRIDHGVIVFKLADDGKIELYSQKVLEERVVDIAFDPDDVEAYRNYVNPEFMKKWLSGGLKETISTDGESGVLLPLIVKERNLGFLYARKKDGEKFTERELKLIHALSSHISMALENARLYTIAITDELTGAFTLRYFQQILEDEMGRYQRYGQKVSLLMVDLDDFKAVNDGYGHPAGDNMLREFSLLANDSIRDVDVLCRYGGEEFAVILPETDSKAAMVVAERIRSRTEERVFKFEDREIKITVSVGVASCPGDGITVRDLVNASDKALYKAKELGKNRVVSW